MNKQEFKKKYFFNNFYWTNKDNFVLLQKIGIKIGCICFTGKVEIINYSDKCNNLAFRTYDGINTTFQREAMLCGNASSTDFNEMLEAYKKLN